MANNWLDKFEYPFESHYIELNAAKMHYIDEGEGEVIFLVHGTPSWSFDFRHLIKALRKNYRCIAIDHIGFGLSEKPKNYDYSTRKHSESLNAFIEAKQLQNINLIVHDFGGPIALNIAIQQPHLFKSVTILNSWLWSSANEPHFIKFSKILKSPLLSFLYLYLNFSARFVLPKSFGKNKLDGHIGKQYTRPFANKNERYGTLAFAKSLLNDQEWFQSLWQQRATLFNKPICVIWGMHDPVVLPLELEKWKQGFPDASIFELPDVGHFPQEESPNLVLEAIQIFLRR